MFAKRIIITAVLPFALACGGPQYVEVEPGSEDVNVVNSVDQSKCEHKGQAKVRITGYAERRGNNTESDLIQLGKNAALENQGNTIYMIDHPEAGKGTQSAVYQIYNCS
tara:strand:+ start:190 stop:516 length:327 start_codon:yes stop_codon:yes gene_type:complete